VKTSESVKEIAGALVKAQMAIKAVVKDKTGRIQGKDGKQGYEYKYSDLASVIEHVKGPLNDNGIVFIQTPERGEGGVTVTTRLLHISGEWIDGDTFVPVPYATAQAFGSGISYAKRYGLQSMTGLPSEDDDGKRATDDDGISPLNTKTNGKTLPNAIPANIEGQEIFAKMTDEAKDYMSSHAKTIQRLYAANQDMVAYVDKQEFDHEDKLALWSLLPSNVRTAYKKQQTANRIPEQA
jgi:hypothetical protein